MRVKNKFTFVFVNAFDDISETKIADDKNIESVDIFCDGVDLDFLVDLSSETLSFFKSDKIFFMSVDIDIN